MDAFYDRLIYCAATIDELLSGDYFPITSQKSDADLSASRLAAWCRSCASGDWLLFTSRLERDGLRIEQTLSRFATVRRSESASPPAWISDAIWIETALRTKPQTAEQIQHREQTDPVAFEDLFVPVVEQAEKLLWSGINAPASTYLSESAFSYLRRSLLQALSELSTPAIYERFAKARKIMPPTPIEQTENPSTSRYLQFIHEMRASGFRALFQDKPVLLRLLAVLTRQWIDTSREFILRFNADKTIIGQTFHNSDTKNRVVNIEGGFSDPHNGGHSVLIVTFEHDSKIVYKPKDMRLDVNWHALVKRLNYAAPIKLRTAQAIARDGYGWAEFISHTACTNHEDYKQFFQRAGAWLALFHCFAGTDIHQENIIASGDHPVPIDLETLFQTAEEKTKTQDSEGLAFEAAMETIANSVMMVGLLPAYGRAPDNSVYAMGGMTSDWNYKTNIEWNNINSDEMRPVKAQVSGAPNPNLPHINGRYARFGDHIEDFISGFEIYAKFLHHQSRDDRQGGLFDGFAEITVRKVIRLTRFYYMLLTRLKDYRQMTDGVIWSAQADFIARLAEWEKNDPLWPLQKAERSALLSLNIPYFTMSADGDEVRDSAGISIHVPGVSGTERARARVRRLDDREIAWQIEVIKANTDSIRRSKEPASSDDQAQITPHERIIPALQKDILIEESKKIAEELARYAIRRKRSAAWIGLDWLGDAEVFQLVCLGMDLYNGCGGIGVFLAAYAAVTGCKSSSELAIAGIAHLRKNLKDRNAARQARALGLGAGIGLGSVIYALTAMSKFLDDDDLLTDAHIASELFTDDLIEADRKLDIIGGSAGGIVALLRLYRDTQSVDVLRRAIRCGEHLMGHSRIGSEGRRSWVGQGFGPRPLNGMSHGASGFAYALASLALVTQREEFAEAASECIAFEDSHYSPEHHNWPDLRGDEGPSWPYQWCHGAPGIGLARAAMMKGGATNPTLLAIDIQNAVEGVVHAWPGRVDTLCCGTLGCIEFLQTAGKMLGRSDLCELASQRLFTILRSAATNGDYRWNKGKRQFNLGLFRGLAGVGYTLLHQADDSLPNVLIWE